MPQEAPVLTVSRIVNKRLILHFGLASTVPLLAMALLFNLPLLFPGTYPPGISLATLGYIMHAEFLAVASGILLILPLLLPARTRLGSVLRFLLFMVVGYGFAWMAYNIDGSSGMLYYALLVFLTFGGGTLLVFDWLTHITRAFITMLRWSVAIFAYVSWQLHFDLDVDIEVWKNTRDVVSFGALYFYTLVLCEAFVYPPLTWYLEQNVKQMRREEEVNIVAVEAGLI
jgi:hypothetical protein